MDDLEQLMDMLDQAMTSDDPRVKDTFRKLMMIVALTKVDDNQTPGPIKQMREKMLELTIQIQSLRNEIQMIQQQLRTPYNPAPYNPAPYNPGYPYTGTPPITTPNTGPGLPGIWWGTGTGPGGNINCSTSIASNSYVTETNSPTITIKAPNEMA